MKKFFIAFVLMAISLPCFAIDWSLASIDDHQNSFYIDKDATAHLASGAIKMVVKEDLATPQKGVNGLYYNVIVVEYYVNCANRMTNAGQEISFMNGALVHKSGSFLSGWQATTPGTVMSSVLDLVCGPLI